MRWSSIALLAMLSSYAGAQSEPGGLPEDPGVKLRAEAAAKEKGPVGAVTFGYLYLASQSAPGGAWDWHLHGFYGIPQYNVKPWMAVFADFTESYNLSKGAHETVQAKLGGFLFTAHAKAKISPLAFADGGAVRDSNNGTVSESPAFAVGGGATYKVNRHLSLLLIPGEYVRTYAQAGDLNNFTARIGFVLPLYR